jgi:hypothetical protein
VAGADALGEGAAGGSAEIVGLGRGEVMHAAMPANDTATASPAARSDNDTCMHAFDHDGVARVRCDGSARCGIRLIVVMTGGARLIRAKVGAGSTPSIP